METQEGGGLAVIAADTIRPHPSQLALIVHVPNHRLPSFAWVLLSNALEDCGVLQ